MNESPMESVKVIYIPSHAVDDLNHPDVERGTLTSLNENYAGVRYGPAGSTSKSTPWAHVLFEATDGHLASIIDVEPYTISVSTTGENVIDIMLDSDAEIVYGVDGKKFHTMQDAIDSLF